MTRPTALALFAALLTAAATWVAGPARAAPPAQVTSATIVSPTDGASVPGGDLELVLRLPEGASAVTQVLVDGQVIEPRAQPGTRGILGPGAPPPADDPQLRRLWIPLPAADGARTIRVVTDVGEPAEVRVQVLPRAADGPPRSRLILLSIGVSQYQAESLRLRYPSKDARDLARRFVGQAGLLFSEVKTRLLIDQSADKGHVLDGLEWLQRETTARDVAVLFLAGHGIRDGSTGAYYFLPWDADLGAIKRTMISQDEIKRTLSALPGKVLVFLDTCFSGSLFAGAERGTAAIDALVQDLLHTENGVVVFASTTGSQTAREAPEWGNGVFTKALVEGLSGRAASPEAPSVTINKLSLYVGDRVKELTGGTQTPTLAMPKGVADFPIAVAVPRRNAARDLVPGAAGSSALANGKGGAAPAAPRRHGWVWAVFGVTAAAALAGAVSAAVILTRPPLYTPSPAF